MCFLRRKNKRNPVTSTCDPRYGAREISPPISGAYATPERSPQFRTTSASGPSYTISRCKYHSAAEDYELQARRPSEAAPNIITIPANIPTHPAYIPSYHESLVQQSFKAAFPAAKSRSDSWGSVPTTIHSDSSVHTHRSDHAEGSAHSRAISRSNTVTRSPGPFAASSSSSPPPQASKSAPNTGSGPLYSPYQGMNSAYSAPAGGEGSASANNLQYHASKRLGDAETRWGTKMLGLGNRTMRGGGSVEFGNSGAGDGPGGRGALERSVNTDLARKETIVEDQSPESVASVELWPGSM